MDEFPKPEHDPQPRRSPEPAAIGGHGLTCGPELQLGLRRLNDRIATEADVFDPSLESIVAAETAVSCFEDVPSLRGYALDDLVKRGTFLETVFLLLYGELPSEEFLADFQGLLTDAAELPAAVAQFIASLPLNASSLDVLRTAVTAMSHFDLQPGDDHTGAAAAQAVRLLARLPLALCERQNSWHNREICDGDGELSFAANLLTMLTGQEPTSLAEAAFEAALTVTAEQGLDASALAARAAVSTGGDLFAAITAAMAVWGGLHQGGPRPEILDWLSSAQTDPAAHVRRAHAQRHTPPGFDVRQSVAGDPRAASLTPLCRRLAVATGHERLEMAASAVEKAVAQQFNCGPTLDWPLTRLLHYLELEPDLFKAVTAVARVAGWAAHAIEQSSHNQLFRPRSRYIGPGERKFTALEERG